MIYHGDALAVLKTLPDASVHCCVTSPPYWGLRDYGTASWLGGDAECDHTNNHGKQGATGQRADRTFTGTQNFYPTECRKCGAKRVDQQLGLERTPEEYVAKLVAVFREVRRLLRPDGTVWLNLGDCYATGAGKVGDCPGGGEQGERWKGFRGDRQHDGKRNSLSTPMGPMTQPNRLPLPGLKPKDLVGLPWRVAFALQADGWWLRSDIIWAKPSPMPESVTDRPTRSHEYIFLLTKSEHYYYDYEAIKEPAVAGHGSGNGYKRTARLSYADGNGARGSDEPYRDGQETRNKRDVWIVNTEPFPEAHFATFPPKLILPCVLAGCPVGGTVLDPFSGAGTTALVAKENARAYIGIELNQDYVAMAEKRLAQEVLF